MKTIEIWIDGVHAHTFRPYRIDPPEDRPTHTPGKRRLPRDGASERDAVGYFADDPDDLARDLEDLADGQEQLEVRGASWTLYEATAKLQRRPGEPVIVFRGRLG